MKKKVDFAEVVNRLNEGQIIPVSEGDWTELAASFPVRDTIPTFMAGDILLVRRPLSLREKKQGWALVEEPPASGQRVIRPLKNEREARALIADRMAAYERMWDG